MKTVRPLPSVASMKERLTYDPETGNLFWVHAPRSAFKSEGSFRLFNSRSAGKIAGHKHRQKNKTPHAIVIRGTFDGEDRWILAHRIIYALMGVDVPEGMEIDHRDRNPWNNKWENLRLATPSQNMYNTLVADKNRTDAGRGLPKGVSPQAGRFKAQISINGKKRHIGMYATPEEAAEAYKRAAQPLHGEFFIQTEGSISL